MKKALTIGGMVLMLASSLARAEEPDPFETERVMSFLTELSKPADYDGFYACTGEGDHCYYYRPAAIEPAVTGACPADQQRRILATSFTGAQRDNVKILPFNEFRRLLPVVDVGTKPFWVWDYDCLDEDIHRTGGLVCIADPAAKPYTPKSDFKLTACTVYMEGDFPE